MHVSGFNISKLYNRFQDPQEIIPFLGLPRIRAFKLNIPPKSIFVTSSLYCISIGATFAVALAQAVTTSVLKSSGQLLPSSYKSLLDYKLNIKETLTISFIDKVNIIRTDPIQTSKRKYSTASALNDRNLKRGPSKMFIESVSDYNVAFRLAWRKEGIIRVKSAHVLKLFKQTNNEVETRRAFPEEKMKKFVGLWTWKFLLRRPCFSISFDTYKFMEDCNKNVT